MPATPDAPYIDRYALSQFIDDPRTLLAFEGLQKVVLVTTPAAVDEAQTAADGAQTAADGAQSAADTAQTAAAAAQSTADTIAAAAFVVLGLSGALSAERVLTPGPGVTLDVSVANAVTLLVDALAILNLAAINLTQPTRVTGGLRTDTLRLDDTLTASVTASDHSVPISIGGTTYYMRLSSTP